jgi:hypothetical protein
MGGGQGTATHSDEGGRGVGQCAATHPEGAVRAGGRAQGVSESHSPTALRLLEPSKRLVVRLIKTLHDRDFIAALVVTKLIDKAASEHDPEATFAEP